jgi:NAD(P)H-nitrite reductase large subunit
MKFNFNTDVYASLETPTVNPMTRCECAEVSFAEALRRVQAARPTVDEVAKRTGCGATCTACIPDLERFLGAGAAY